MRHQIASASPAPKLEIVLGRKPTGVVEGQEFNGLPQGEVKLGANHVSRYIFRKEFSNVDPKHSVRPEEIDGEFERVAAQAAFDEATTFWSSDDGDARAVRRFWGKISSENERGDPIPADSYKTSSMIVYTANPPDAGMGSGGPGSAKVFWAPYSLPDRVERLKRANNPSWDGLSKDLGVDPMYVMGHELHHAFGSNTELDLTSDVVGVAAHLRSGLQHNPVAASQMVRSFVDSAGFSKSKARKRVYAQAVRYLHNRFGSELDRLMVDIPDRWDPTRGIYSREEWAQAKEKILRRAGGE